MKRHVLCEVLNSHSGADGLSKFWGDDTQVGIAARKPEELAACLCRVVRQ